MNPGHLEQGVFKVPPDKIPHGSRSLELDTPPPSQSLPVTYGYAPNVAVRTDASTLPLTPPQASPPEALMSDISSAQLSLMSKHLLSTTTPSAKNADSSLHHTLLTNALKDLPSHLLTTLSAASTATSFPNTLLQSQLHHNSAPGGEQQIMVTQNDLQTSGQPQIPNGLINANSVPAPVTQLQPRPAPKKSKKRRRKSDSSEGAGTFGSAPLDGSPRLIKKIGRVIQTVETEQDLDIQVDAMLKNIMGKFQQRQAADGQSPSAAPTHCTNAHAQATTSGGAQGADIAQYAASMPSLQSQPVNPAPSTQATQPRTAKKRSRSKKKSTNDVMEHVDAASVGGSSSTDLQLSLPDLESNALHEQQQQQQLIHFPQHITNSEAIAAASIAALSSNQAFAAAAAGGVSQHQPLLQTLPASSSTHAASNPVFLAQDPTALAVNNQNIHQQMAAVDAYEVCKKMLQEAGITVPGVVAKQPLPGAVGGGSGSVLSDSQIMSALFPPADRKSSLSELDSPPLADTGAGLHNLPVITPHLPGAAALQQQQHVTSHTTAGGQFMTSSSSSPMDAPPDLTPAAWDPNTGLAPPKKAKKLNLDKLTERDIANITSLLRIANSHYFVDFFNQLQAFALGKNPDWFNSYPNIATYTSMANLPKS